MAILMSLPRMIGYASTVDLMVNYLTWPDLKLKHKEDAFFLESCCLLMMLLEYFTRRRDCKISLMLWKMHVEDLGLPYVLPIPKNLPKVKTNYREDCAGSNRKSDGRISKEISYAELARGKNTIGRQKLTFKDVCKRDIRTSDIDYDLGEEIAQHRTAWRQSVRDLKPLPKSTKNENHRHLSIFQKCCPICGGVCNSRIEKSRICIVIILKQTHLDYVIFSRQIEFRTKSTKIKSKLKTFFNFHTSVILIEDSSRIAIFSGYTILPGFGAIPLTCSSP
ncbi:hypothetical protein HELRODRAFT_167635 [Helobdella robusta]|uniref:Uncharacterized protein n=1 Tax=Helobdella robusta TaxID=6412 RepID=T1EZL2_HELRO|nr:hypothetical protein HELRODRAFT_167635 [Helobdella robusta]ESO11100.1 hypothetical protein HELRODRAFT_167635 [Helobdella robusta]